MILSLPTYDPAALAEVCAELGVTLTDSDLQVKVDNARAALAQAQARPIPVWGLDGLVDTFENAPKCENPF